jgi:hypothetical protein
VRTACPSARIWTILQEPPVGHRKAWHQGVVGSGRVFMQDPANEGERFSHTHGALAWHVNRSYDYLSRCPIPEKQLDISWVTSNLRKLPGHRSRMTFLRLIRPKIEFSLFGRGHAWIADKWDAIAPYRYSIAVENFSGPDYWTEKISDCFLSWAMPIYFGCTNIDKYFPPESFIQIDISAPDEAVERIREAVGMNLWAKRLDAIAEARDRVLNRHQLFPFLAEQIWSTDHR